MINLWIISIADTLQVQKLRIEVNSLIQKYKRLFKALDKECRVDSFWVIIGIEHWNMMYKGQPLHEYLLKSYNIVTESTKRELLELKNKIRYWIDSVLCKDYENQSNEELQLTDSRKWLSDKNYTQENGEMNEEYTFKCTQSSNAWSERETSLDLNFTNYNDTSTNTLHSCVPIKSEQLEMTMNRQFENTEASHNEGYINTRNKCFDQTIKQARDEFIVVNDQEQEYKSRYDKSQAIMNKYKAFNLQNDFDGYNIR